METMESKKKAFTCNTCNGPLFTDNSVITCKGMNHKLIDDLMSIWDSLEDGQILHALGLINNLINEKKDK